MKKTIHCTFRETTLGLACMAGTADGVCFVAFGENQHSLMADLKKDFPGAIGDAPDAPNHSSLNSWMAALGRHLDNNTELPDVPLDVDGTDFQRLVWQTLATIPEGQVLTYSQLAEKVGRPRAVRAVASACGSNRIGVLIPCHRVLRSDGQLGGYRWGLSRKRALLDAEKSRIRVENPVKIAS